MKHAVYVSEWDDGDVVCESECEFNPETLTVTNIRLADNAEEADQACCRTDEYVELDDGTKLREEDGVTFDY